MTRKTIKQQLRGSAVSIGLLVLALAVSSIWTISHVADEFETTINRDAPRIDLLTQFTISLAQLQEDALSFAFASAVENQDKLQDKELEELTNQLTLTSTALASYGALTANPGDPDVKVHEKIADRFETLRGKCDRLTTLVKNSSENPIDLEHHHYEVEEAIEEMIEAIGEALVLSIERLNAGMESARRTRNTAIAISGGIMIVALLAAISLMTKMSNRLRAPIRELKEAAARFGTGDFTYQVGAQELEDFSLLAHAFNDMAQDITKYQAKQEKLSHELSNASRAAGMSEVITGMLHNVGNVMNSINVTTSRVHESARKSRVHDLTKAAELLNSREDLAAFLTEDDAGKHFPEFLTHLASNLTHTQESLLKDLDELTNRVNHVKQIITSQQSLAKTTEITEIFDLASAIDDAININIASFNRHHIDVSKTIDVTSDLHTDRHKLLQILGKRTERQRQIGRAHV